MIYTCYLLCQLLALTTRGVGGTFRPWPGERWLPNNLQFLEVFMQCKECGNEKIIVYGDHIHIEYDPNRLILNQSPEVPSKGLWLPGPSLLGTKIVNLQLPDRFYACQRQRLRGP